MKVILLALAFLANAVSLLLQRLGRDKQSLDIQNWAPAATLSTVSAPVSIRTCLT